MLRAKVGDIARLADCSHHFVRRFADGGYIKFTRDVNNWRIFPNPSEAASTIRQLLGVGQLETTEVSVNDLGREGANECIGRDQAN